MSGRSCAEDHSDEETLPVY